jgi:hypothetical protein
MSWAVSLRIAAQQKTNSWFEPRFQQTPNLCAIARQGARADHEGEPVPTNRQLLNFSDILAEYLLAQQ